MVVKSIEKIVENIILGLPDSNKINAIYLLGKDEEFVGGVDELLSERIDKSVYVIHSVLPYEVYLVELDKVDEM